MSENEEKQEEPATPQNNEHESKKKKPQIGLLAVFAIMVLSILAVALAGIGDAIGHIEDRSAKSLSFFFLAEMLAGAALYIVYRRRKPDLWFALVVAIPPVMVAIKVAAMFFHLMSPEAELDFIRRWPALCEEIVIIAESNGTTADGNKTFERIEVAPSSFTVYFDEGVKTMEFADLNGTKRVMRYDFKGIATCQLRDGSKETILPNNEDIKALRSAQEKKEYIREKERNLTK